MKLSQYERQVLINQLTIRKAVEKGGDTEYLDEAIQILRFGYEIFYGQVFEAYADEDVMGLGEGRLVLDVLTMYGVLEAFKDRHPDEKPRLNEKPFGHFQGFDGNEEAAHMGFARFLIKYQGKFIEQRAYRTDDFNSHMSTIEPYNRMLEVFKYVSPAEFGSLPAAKAHAIVDAAITAT